MLMFHVTYKFDHHDVCSDPNVARNCVFLTYHHRYISVACTYASVCVYALMYEYGRVYNVCVFKCICMHVCRYVWMDAQMYARVYVYIYVCM